MRKHNYLVGYRGEGQCIYGLPEEQGGPSNFTDLMTLFQAKKLSKEITSESERGKIKSVVYKLVEAK